ADQPPQALHLAGCRLACLVARLGVGAAGDDAGQGDLVEPRRPLARCRRGTRLDRAACADAAAIAGDHVLQAGRQPGTGLAVAELHEAATLGIFADDVDRLLSPVAIEAVDPAPQAALDPDFQFRGVRRYGPGAEQVGER